MSQSNVTICPKSECGKENPAGAKFCSACAAALINRTDNPATTPSGSTAAGASLPPPSPPASQRPGLGGMMGQMGGKSEQRQIAGDPASLFAAAVQFIESRADSEVKNQFAPQQISASIMFKDFLATMNSPVRLDAEISITPIAPGQNTVSVGSKIDWGSTMTIWIVSTVLFFMLLFLFNPYMQYTMIYVLLFAVSSVSTVMLINSRGPKNVADDLFNHLRDNAGVAPFESQAQVPESDTHPPSHPPTTASDVNAPPAAPAIVQSNGDVKNEESAAETEVEPMERIRQLAELRKEGLITDEEFESKKVELLERI